ncbi:MAG: septal ring lytic transglycosylase RlpA family protein [Candidatus Obscuribacterales bacterium]|nr:septal ring lytic transglycosylase RlpA family protein [Candidatus Obscuribacterales bacterium]
MRRTMRPLTKACFSVLGLKSGGQFLIVLAALASVSSANGVQAEPEKDSGSSKANIKKSNKTFSGNVSWYGAQFNGKKTACGDIFDMNKKTAAHKTLPFHTKVLVEDPHTGQSVVVVVNDRGPFVKTRVMDLSRGGAVSLGTIHKGVCRVDCTVLDNN